MSIATRLEAIEEHLTDDYSVLELAGSDLTNVDKNIVNLKPTWKERLLYFINNGTDIVWDNWEKVVGEGTELTLSNTEQAPMKVLLKGNTYQDSTILPSEYTQVEYISSNANANIITDFTVSAGENYSAIVDTQYNEIISGNQIIVSSGTNAWVGQASGYYACGSSVKTTVSATDRVLLKATFGSQTTITIGEETAIRTGISSEAGKVRVFGNSPFVSNAKIFSCKLYNSSNVLVCDLIPCYRNSDNVIGMYDLVNKKFYYNSGSGTFTKGNDATLPNPDYPQEVHTVSGDNEVEVVGKNLAFTNVFDKQWGVSGSGNNRTITSSSSYKKRALVIKVKPSTTYTISGDFSELSNEYIRIGSFDNEPQVGSTSTKYDFGASPFTFITDTNTKYIMLFNSNNEDTIISNLQLEKGSQATTYTPYTGQSYPVNLGAIELCKIGDYQDEIFKSSGKNLFDKDSATYKNGYYLNGSGVETSSDSAGYTTSYIPVKPNTTYTLSGTLGSGDLVRVYYFNETKNWIDRSGALNIPPSRTFTTPLNCYYIGFQYAISTYNASTVMLNEGATALPYEPYGTDWYLKKEIGKVDLGTLTWVSENQYSAGQFRNNSNYWQNGVPLLSGGLKCSIFIYQEGAVSYNSLENGKMAITNSQSYPMLRVRNTQYSTYSENDFKTAMNGIYVYYQMYTPTYTKIEGTLASQLEEVYRAKSKEGQTNISQTNNDLPFVLDVSALSKE